MLCVVFVSIVCGRIFESRRRVYVCTYISEMYMSCDVFHTIFSQFMMSSVQQVTWLGPCLDFLKLICI